MIRRSGKFLKQISPREELRNNNRVEVAVENLYKLDDLWAVPQLYQNLNLLLGNLLGGFQILGGVQDLALLGSSSDTEHTAEGSTCDLSFLLVLKIERKLENDIRIICSSATISSFGPVLEFYK